MPSYISLLGPVVGLNLWTFGMEAWMYALRIPAFEKYGIKLDPNLNTQSMNAKLPPSVQWPAQNYNHLHEQPTTFYAVALTLALLGKESGVTDLDVNLAWAYVGVRVLHSLVHATQNKIMARFSLFVTSSAILLGLTGRTAALIYSNLV